jgi:hypothetical protein
LIGGRSSIVDVPSDILIFSHQTKHLFEAVDGEGVELALAFQKLSKKRLLCAARSYWADIGVSLLCHPINEFEAVFVAFFSISLTRYDLAESEDPLKAMKLQAILHAQERLQS